MKKFIKILGITLIVIAFLVIICAIIAPPIAKNYVNKHGKELVGRKIQINGLYSNLFTATTGSPISPFTSRTTARRSCHSTPSWSTYPSIACSPMNCG